MNVAKHRPVPTDMERIQPSTILALIAVWICVGASLASSADEIGLLAYTILIICIFGPLNGSPTATNVVVVLVVVGLLVVIRFSRY